MDPKYARETKGPEILGVFWALYIVSLLMVAARLYTRALWLRNIGLDDYIIAVCMVLVSAFTALTTAMVILGYGRHSQVVVAAHGPKRLSNLTLMSQINYTLGIMSFATPKFAIAALLNRALWHPELLATGATCRPLMLVAKYAIFTGAISAFADMYLAIYPVVVLSRLQMTLKKKLALCGVLGLGSVACVMAIIKCFQLPSLTNTTDSTCNVENVNPSSVEANVITMASCIPTLGPWWEMLRGKRSEQGEGNQERILQEEQNAKSTTRPVGSIQRTDQVAVEYEMGVMDREGGLVC
ncbi:hypothetical protein BDV18DRAFT_166309 [Aspergillus unguis]